MYKFRRIVIAMAILNIAAGITFGDDNFFYYYEGTKNYMIINPDFVSVDINSGDLIDWNTIYDSEPALDASTPPEYLTGNTYRLKVANIDETDNLVTSLVNYDGIIEANYGFMTPDGMDYYLGSVLEVMFKDNINEAVIDSIANANVLQIKSRFGLLPRLYSFITQNLSKIQLLNLGNELYEKDFAELAVVSNIVPISLWAAPNDEFYEYQYNLHSDQTDFEETYEYNLKDTSILVAFLDGGLEPHEDLPADKIKCGWDYANDTMDYSVPDACTYPGQQPGCYHGLAVVGTMAATIDNELGLAGTANQVKLIMNKIYHYLDWADWSIVKEAFNDAVDSGAVIVSNSWGLNTCYPPPGILLLYPAIHMADSAGVLVIFAAGNCSNPPPSCGDCVMVPAEHEDVIAVGATDHQTGGRWEFSAYGGDDLDVCAPGEDMIILDQMGTAGMTPAKCSGLDPNYNCYYNGTSYAAPQVAGLAALIMARKPEFIGQPDTIKEIIYYSTGNGWHYPAVEETHNKTSQMGYGRINAARAMLAISRGDVNNDLNYDILDITLLINYKYHSGAPPTPNVLLGDVDCSGTIDILDIVYLINFTNKGGPPPPRCYKF